MAKSRDPLLYEQRVMELAAAARRRYTLGFEEVALHSARLSYEPRSSCQCTRACAAAWVGAKSGAVMRLELTRSKPIQSWFPGDREARSVCHVHDGLASDGGSVLLIGRDDGCLEIVPDRHPEWSDRMPAQRCARSIGQIHLDAWWAQRTERPQLTIEDVVESAPDAPAQYAMGVTAIAALPRAGAPDTIDILVATRHPWLYVIEACAGTLRLTHRVSLPGWIDWIFAPRYPDGPITCLSRGGDLVRFTLEVLRRGGRPTSTTLSILPTAALWVGAATLPLPHEPAPGVNDGNLLIGTTTGLFLICDGPGDELAIHAVPVTRAGVLSLGTAFVRDTDGTHEYVTLGLDDGRLRVVAIDLIHDRTVGATRQRTTQSFSVDLGAAVLAQQTLQPEHCPPDHAYMLAVLRDHSMRLFEVTSEQTQRVEVIRAWEAYLGLLATSPAQAEDPAFELEVASCAVPSGIEAAHWTYLLVDVVLPRLCARVATLPTPDLPIVYGRIADVAYSLVHDGADRRTLRRLSGTLPAVTGGDIRRAQQLSAAIVRAAVVHRDADALAFIESHLRDLNMLAGACADEDRPLLVFWMRFVRKYIVRGPAFAGKRFRLTELVEQNHQARKHFDALIYQARLHRQGYDLRWEARLDGEVAAVHLARCAGRAIVVVVTAAGRLVVLDRASGDRLAIDEAGRRHDALAPFKDHGDVRTLASAVVEDRGVARVVISGDGAKLPPPGLAVIDLSRDARADGTLTVVSVSRPTCDAPTRVHAIQPLPGRADTFVLGLDTREHPVGRLHRGRTWTLERAVRAGSADRLDDEGPQLAPGKVPTRAIAVVETDARGARFLAAAGSDDGWALAFTLTAEDRAADWRVTGWSRVTDPIRSVVLGRHDRHGAVGRQPAGDASLFSCYLSTSAGDTLALAIVGTQARIGGAIQPFGPYFAQALWRETLETPVLAARIWQTALFRVASDPVPADPDQVLVLVTEGGRLCIYHHAGMRSDRVSTQNNYYFRGLRQDRVALPDLVSAFALADSESEIVAATPDGQVYLAKLIYLPGSAERCDPETRQPPPGASRGDAARGAEPPPLPTESWARLHELFTASQIDEPFNLPHDQRASRKLELCELVRLDHGVLSAYALRERLTYDKPWDPLDVSQIRDRARALLHGLRSDHREDAERIKVILKSLCGAFLSRHPDKLRGELLAQPRLPPAEHDAIVAVCDLVHEEILSHLTHPTRAGSRLAIVAMKELLRMPMLRAMASADTNDNRVRDAVGTALVACLRHDDRLVRTETLRAVSVMLRNVGVMVRARPDARDQLLVALFPEGLASLAWLLDPIIDGLLRSPGFSARTVLVSRAWYRVSAIAQLFWIFPNHTLTLCDHLLGRGLPVDVLALCMQTMRGEQVKETRNLIEYWFLLPTIDPDCDRVRFFGCYRMYNDPHPPPALSTPWHEIVNETMALRMRWLLDQLARMWGVKKAEQLRALGTGGPRPSMYSGKLPLVALEDVVAQLAVIARDLGESSRRDARLQDLQDLRNPENAARGRLARPISTIVSAIAAHWIDLCEPRSPTTGMTIGRFVLGESIEEGGFGKVFEIQDPPEGRSQHVIKVLKRFTPGARDRFVMGARLNQKLSSHAHVAKVVEIVEPESSRPAYVMFRYKHSLHHHLGAARRAWASEWAAVAARQIGEALGAAHAQGDCHGDVKPSNILVGYGPRTNRPSFFLADFDLARVPDDSEYIIHGIVPPCLSRKCKANDESPVRQWLDIAALCLIAYRMLTGEEVVSDTKNLGACSDRLAQLATDQSSAQDVRHLIATLQRVFDLEDQEIQIDQFLEWLQKGPPLRSRPTRILFLAANPIGTTPLPALDRELRDIRDRLWGRPDVEFIKESAVRIKDLVMLVSQVGPDILHFGGHGSPNGLILDDDDGHAKLVTGDALARFLGGRGVALVVLNSCYSKHQADEILPMVDVVVGTTHSVNDEAARRFSVMLYQQIFAGSTIGAAFKDACDTVGLHDMSDVFHDAIAKPAGRDVVTLGLHGMPDVFHAAGKLDLVLVPRRR